MTLEKTEPPLHVPPPMQVPGPIKCDYLDVARVPGDQTRFSLQPHKDGGTPIGPALILEREGAMALIRHLESLLAERDAS